MVGTMAHVSRVMRDIKVLKELRAESVGVADSRPDVRLSMGSIAPDAKTYLRHGANATSDPRQCEPQLCANIIGVVWGKAYSWLNF